MKDKNIIETLGKITKKELIGTIEPDLSGGFMLLENRYPFPGYHGNTIPDFHELIPDSIFAMTKSVYDEETILRAAHATHREFGKKFDATPGQLNVFNQTQPCVRIKYLQSYHDLAHLITLFHKHGIQFLKYRKVEPYEGLIKIEKFYLLELLEPGIYLDLVDDDMCYLQLPYYIDWNTFEKITLSMKRNMEDNKFDAAQAVILRKNCVLDCVRIYDHHIKHDKIIMIRDRYLKEINKLK